MNPINHAHVRIHAHEEGLQHGPYDVLMLGDSAAAQSFSPKTFLEITGKDAYNFGTYSRMTAVSDIYFLEQYLQQFPPPDFVFIVRSFRSWNQEFPFELYTQYFSKAHIIHILLEHNWIGLEDAISFYVTRRMPSLQFAWEFKNVLKWNLFPKTRPRGRLDSIEAFHARSDNGFYSLEDKEIDANEFAETQKEIESLHQEDTLKVFRHNDVLTRRLCQLAEKYDFVAGLTAGPHVQELESSKNVQEVLGGIDGYLESISETEAGCAYVYGLQKVYSAELMRDSVHTNLAGAYKFTEELATAYNNFRKSQNINR